MLHCHLAADDIAQPGAKRQTSYVNTELLTLERTTPIAAIAISDALRNVTYFSAFQKTLYSPVFYT